MPSLSSTPFAHQFNSTPRSRSAVSRRLLAFRAFLLGALLLAGFGAALTAAPAALAHDELVSSTPADGTVLEEAPAELELVFSSELMDIGNKVIVADAAGTNLVESDPVLNRETLVQALPALENGAYQVNWRAVSSDGHPITGTFSFTVDAPGSDAAETNAPAGTPTESAAASATAEPTAESSDPAATEESVASHVPWALGGAAVGAIIALAVWAVVAQLKKRRRGAGS
ncbi:copper resistance CopC family protein [Arthrobacter sunyaminii]|uniref:Copper resistance protein CopC n=1 Tax=Arthrobacter sunyaminii TaxID=2816859 RepID=A0A975PF13_9MICC|nr:copper resistance CopC family protein [Arthrobacter sunyaminii]MBO0908667.1 copper resistance protein CopC [Arthrobacter sunyaminii]QWQ35809.1 copper resistance protein CopC [Arthrobacter sunyaminii]